jgi:hypothetical protein
MRYLVLTPYLAFGTLKVHTLNKLAILMRIMPGAKWIGRAHPGLANFLVGL